MYKISLLPSEYRQFQKSIQKRSNLVLVGGIIIVLLFAVYSLISLASLVPQQQLKAIQQDNAKLEQQIAAMNQYEQMLNKTNALEDLAKQAMGTAPEWRSVVLGIAGATPEGMWLSNISAKYEQSSGIGLIKGWALSHKDVSDWMAIMETVPGISNIKCSVSEETLVEGMPAVQFEAKMTILPGAGLDLKAEGGDSSAK